MVRISPEIYSGGAVLFDTRSLFDYQQKIADRIAKKQAAEQEAIDNYLKELAKTPDPYGIRTNDYDVYKKKLEDYRALYNDYKKSPRDATKRFKLEQAADGLKIFVARSKEEKEKDKSYINLIASLATDPEKRKTTDFDRLIADKTNQDLPLDFKGVAALGIPARKDKDFNPNYYTPKFDFQATFDNAAKGPGITTSELSVTPSKTRGYNVIQKGFGVSAIKSIASNFGNDVESDDDKKSYYKTKFNTITPEKLTEQNIRLKKYFPKMEVDDDNPVSLAMAEAIEEAERRTSSDLVAVSRGTTVNVGGGKDQSKQKLSGNAIDEVGSIDPVTISTKDKNGFIGKGIIKDGVARDNTGNLYTGKVNFSYEYIPANLVAVLDFNKTPLDQDEPIIVHYKNGEAIGITQPGKPFLSRKAIENAQLKYNTEGLKGQQPTFGRELKNYIGAPKGGF